MAAVAALVAAPHPVASGAAAPGRERLPWTVQRARSVEAVQAIQAAVDAGVANAAQRGIHQAVAVVDRSSGARVASRHGSDRFISESITKLFTVAYYRTRAAGNPDPALAAQLQTMIIHSDDAIESDLWRDDVVPSMASRYGLHNTGNGPKTGPHDWGWELITADDETDFLYRISHDDLVGPALLATMAQTAPTGSDGFDQTFGLNALSGEHGSKQGWTDQGTTAQVQIHSVGWVDGEFVAILQTSDQAGDDEMRATATFTAQHVQRAIEMPAPPALPAPAPRSKAYLAWLAAVTAPVRELAALVRRIFPVH